jgi:hypothetical protein
MAKYAALWLLDAPSEHLRLSIGTLTKHAANPLFEQDQPWETRIDNGYPNVIPPATADEPFQLWYGTCTFSCDRQMLLYANSTDGLRWTKPKLGLFNLDTANIAQLKGFGKANNILVEGGGIGVYRDASEPDAARRFKAIGPGCWTSPTLAKVGDGDCLDYTLAAPQTRRFTGSLAASADGLTWPHVANLSWPPPQKWDTHTNVFFDEPRQRYVATTRSIPVEPDGVEREVSLATSPSRQYAFDTSAPPPIILRGNGDHQPYAQITWRWLNVYLGLVMVLDAKTPEQQVHCRLVWSPTPEGEWRPVEGTSVTNAPDLLPLGVGGAFDSHIVFAAATPFRHGTGDAAAERLYYMGGNGPHGGPRNSSLGLATLRPDGYACVRGRGTFRTPRLTVAARTIVVSVDFAAAGGALRVGVLPDGAEPPIELSLNRSVPLTANATDAPMAFVGGADLSSLVGTMARLELRLEGEAMLYAVGFAMG